MKIFFDLMNLHVFGLMFFEFFSNMSITIDISHDVMDSLRQQEIVRRCEKMSHMSHMHYVQAQIWIDVRARSR